MLSIRCEFCSVIFEEKGIAAMMMLTELNLEKIKQKKADEIMQACNDNLIESQPKSSDGEIQSMYDTTAKLCIDGNIKKTDNIIYLFSISDHLLSDDAKIKNIVLSENLIESAKLFHIKNELIGL